MPDLESLSSTPLNYATPEQIQGLQQWAQSLQQQSGQPVRHWTEGVANIVRSLMGGLAERQAMTMGQQGYQQGMDEMLKLRIPGLGGGGGGSSSPAPPGSIPTGPAATAAPPLGNTPEERALNHVSQNETGRPWGPRSVMSDSADAHNSTSSGSLGLNTWSRSRPAAWTSWSPDQRMQYERQFFGHIYNETPSMVRAAGFGDEIANNPGVMAFMADRNIQHGTIGRQNALAAARGASTPQDFINKVSAYDMGHIRQHFPSALSQNPNIYVGLQHRIQKRQDFGLNESGANMAPKTAGAPPPTAPAAAAPSAFGPAPPPGQGFIPGVTPTPAAAQVASGQPVTAPVLAQGDEAVPMPRPRPRDAVPLPRPRPPGMPASPADAALLNPAPMGNQAIMSEPQVTPEQLRQGGPPPAPAPGPAAPAKPLDAYAGAMGAMPPRHGMNATAAALTGAPPPPSAEPNWASYSPEQAMQHGQPAPVVAQEPPPPAPSGPPPVSPGMIAAAHAPRVSALPPGGGVPPRPAAPPPAPAAAPAGPSAAPPPAPPPAAGPERGAAEARPPIDPATVFPPLDPQHLRSFLMNRYVPQAEKDKVLAQYEPRTIEDPSTGDQWLYRYGMPPARIKVGLGGIEKQVHLEGIGTFPARDMPDGSLRISGIGSLGGPGAASGAAGSNPLSALEPIQNAQAERAAVAAGKKKMAEKGAEDNMVRIGEIQKQSRTAERAISTLGLIQDTVNKYGDGIITGPAADQWLKVSQFLNSIGVNIGNPTNLQASEVVKKLNAQLASAELPAFTQRGTQFDLKTFMENNPGLLNSIEGTRVLSDILMQGHRIDRKLANLAADRSNWDNWYEVENKFFENPENQVRNPLTGNRMGITADSEGMKATAAGAKGGDPLAQARAAIAAGAPREKVIERLKSMGINAGGL